MNKTTAGQAFQKRFLADYESDRAVDRQALGLACQLLDEIEDMTEQVARDGYMVTGSQQQLVAHPLIRELRAHRKAFLDVAKTLAPDAPVLAGQALAQRRWNRNGGRYRPKAHAQARPERVYIPDPQPEGAR